MAREGGFAVADLSSVHLDDEKVRKLWRRLDDVGMMCEAITIHLATVLASWKEGRRVPVSEAVPLWLPARPELVDALVEVGLLDRSGRVPARTWSSWYGPAAARKMARVEAGRLGGLASGKRRRSVASSDAVAEPNPSGRQAGPSVPSVIPVRPPRRARSPKGGATHDGPVSLGDALAGTPFGEAMAARKRGAG